MIKRIQPFKYFRLVGLIGIILLGFITLVGTGGGDADDTYLAEGKQIDEPPPASTNTPASPVIFDLSFFATGGASISFRISFNDAEADVTTFCVAFDDQPDKYYAYNVKSETEGKTAFRLTVTDVININTPDTYCFTVFVLDEAGHTSNKLSGCFYVECETCYDDCMSTCDDGTMSIQGRLAGDPIDFSGDACAMRNDNIEVGLFCNGAYIGLEIKEPGKLAAGTTFAVKPHESDEVGPDDFPIVVERYRPDHWKQSASGGTFTVITYHQSALVAEYELIMPDGGVLSGRINVRNFEDFEQEI